MRHGTAFRQYKAPSASEEAAESLAIRRGLIHELMAFTCRCGRAKGHGYSLCATCFHALPENLRSALYKRIGEGYDEAYARACRVLDLATVARQAS